MKRSNLLPLLLWTLLWGLFFGTLLLAIDRLPDSDLSGQFHAFGLFQFREISAGRLPVWSPGSYGGVPFAADTQAAVFYPPRWITLLLSLIPGSLSFYALELEGLLHIWLSGLFVYFLAADITRSAGIKGNTQDRHRLNKWTPFSSQWAGLLAAVAFGLGGYLTSYPLLQLAVLETVAWLPLILWLLRRGVYAGDQSSKGTARPVPMLLAAGVVLGVSALAGHPQTFLHVALLAAVYFLFLTWQARWHPLWMLGLGLMIAVVGVGVALPSFLPALRFLPYTVRSDLTYDFLAEGFSLLDYIQVVIPGPLSIWLPQYTGLVTLFLALMAGIGRHQWPRIRQQKETVFWIVVVLAAAWLSLGDKGILFEITYRLAPKLSLFRQQERLVNLVSLGMALLGAQGLALWLRAPIADRRRWTRKCGIIAAVALLLVGLIFLLARTTSGQNDWLSLWLRQWFILILLIAILWPFNDNWQRKGLTWRSLALIILLFLDLFFPLRKAMDLQPESPAVFWPQPAWLAPLLADDGRFDSQNLFHANMGELYGLQDERGISPLKPQYLAEFERLDRPLRWQLLNVQHVLAPKRIEESLIEIMPVTQSILPGMEADGFLYRFEDALPRAWMVYKPIIKATPDEAFDFLKSAEFDPVTQVVLTDPDLEVVGPLTISETPPLMTIEKLPGSGLAISIESDAPGIMVISEWALPGWEATIDGQNVPLLTANYALLGLHVAQGKHEIRINYGTRDVRTGLIFALAVILIAVVIARRWYPQIPTRPEKAESFGDSPEGIGGRIANPPLQDKGDIGTKALTSRQIHWLMTGVVLLGFGLRVFLLGSQELRGDEAFSFLFSKLPFAEVVPELIDQGDPHSPLHYLLLNSWVDLAGESELAMRFLSLIPGVLLLPLLFQLGREMVSKRLGLLAAFLAALSPSLIWLSQDLRNQYTLAILFTTAATWALVKVSDPLLIASSRKKWLYWGLYVLLGALSVYGHYYALFALLANGLYLWFAPQRRRSFWPWLMAGAAIFLLFLPWLLVVWSGLLKAGQLSDPGNPELTAHLVNIGRELLTGSTLTGPWTRWLFLGALIFVLLGFDWLRRRKPGWAAMLAGWLGGAALIIFLVRYSRSTFNEFYISVAAPAWILLLAAGLFSGWLKGGWRRIVTTAAFIIILTATTLSLRNLYFDPSFSRTLGYRQVAAFIGAQVQPGDLFVAHFPDPALDYYLQDVPIPRLMNPPLAGMSDADVEQNLAHLMDDYDRAWFVPYNHSVWDVENVVPRWLDYHMLHEQEVQLDRLTLQAFRPERSRNGVMHQLDITFGSGIRLDSVYMTVDGRPVNLSQQPLVIKNESKLKVSLLWTALEALDQDYTVFVHLVDENGNLMGQHDGIPLFGTRPTYTWQEGEQLLDRHELQLSEQVSGRGRLVIGLYDSETFERLELSSEQDVYLLADVIVE